MDKNHMFLPNWVHKQALREVPWGFLIAAVLHMTILPVVQKGKAICQHRDFTTHILLYFAGFYNCFCNYWSTILKPLQKTQ